MTVPYRGYCRETTLPIKEGQKVKLPRGTLYTYRGEIKEVTRAFTVTVDHLLPGRSAPVGTYYPMTGVIDFDVPVGAWDPILDRYGTTKPEELWPLIKTEPDVGHACMRLTLPLDNPSIRWVGAAGYWCEAEINQLVSPPKDSDRAVTEQAD